MTQLGTLISRAQDRVLWYKSQLEEVHRDRSVYPEWYRELLRDAKNFEMNWLKTLQEEAYWNKLM